MILCDAGPLVALVDRRDGLHSQSVATLATLPPIPLRTTWHCLTEAMHLLGRGTGFAGQDALWSYIADGLVTLYAQPDDEWPHMRALMRQYSDTPMDLADASLVLAAERLGERRIFTFDHHFRAYRVGKGRLQMIPQ